MPVSSHIRNGEQRKRKIKGFIFDIFERRERERKRDVEVHGVRLNFKKQFKSKKLKRNYGP